MQHTPTVAELQSINSVGELQEYFVDNNIQGYSPSELVPYTNIQIEDNSYIDNSTNTTNNYYGGKPPCKPKCAEEAAAEAVQAIAYQQAQSENQSSSSAGNIFGFVLVVAILMLITAIVATDTPSSVPMGTEVYGNPTPTSSMAAEFDTAVTEVTSGALTVAGYVVGFFVSVWLLIALPAIFKPSGRPTTPAQKKEHEEENEVTKAFRKDRGLAA